MSLRARLLTDLRLGPRHFHRARRHDVPSTSVVVLTTGWSGDLVLARLLGAGGTVRVVGRPLRRYRPDAIAHVLRQLAHSRGGERAQVALVHPDDLWLTNAIDPDAAVRRLADSGCQLVTLRRRSALDTALSRIVCGESEVLPRALVHVEPEYLATHEQNAAYAWRWQEQVAPGAPVVTFEDDLETTDARQATADRFASLLGLATWSAPEEHALPDHDTIWSLAVGASELRQRHGQLRGLLGPIDG